MEYIYACGRIVAIKFLFPTWNQGQPQKVMFPVDRPGIFFFREPPGRQQTFFFHPHIQIFFNLGFSDNSSLKIFFIPLPNVFYLTSTKRNMGWRWFFSCRGEFSRREIWVGHVFFVPQTACDEKYGLAMFFSCRE